MESKTIKESLESRLNRLNKARIDNYNNEIERRKANIYLTPDKKPACSIHNNIPDGFSTYVSEIIRQSYYKK